MKSTLIALILLATGSTVAFAQCDKTVMLSSSHTQHLDGNGTLEQTEDEKTTLEISATGILISVVNDNGTQKMSGNIKSKTCDWKVPFKDGKMVISTNLKTDDADNGKEFKITIEGKDGKVTLNAESPDMPDRKLRLDIDKFEEKK